MTTPTPLDVRVEYEAEVMHPTSFLWHPLRVENIVASMDVDRVPFCQATLTLGLPAESTWAMLDPRNIDPTVSDSNIRFRMRLLDADGNVLSWLGRSSSDDDTWCYLHVRSVQSDDDTGEVTVQASGREQLMDDKKRLADTAIDTGATNVDELVGWSLIDVFGSYGLTSDSIVLSTAIPAGDRRLMQPGDSHSALIEPELSAINCRLYDYWGQEWFAVSRDNPPTYIGAPTTVRLSTLTVEEGGRADADPIAHGLRRTLTRDGDWADGIGVRFDMTDAGGTVTFQRSGGGANTRGLIVTKKRPKPAANMADKIVARSVIRGRDFELDARARFDVLPGMNLTVYGRIRNVSGSIRSVEWNAEEALMRISAQTGDPIS